MQKGTPQVKPIPQVKQVKQVKQVRGANLRGATPCGAHAEAGAPGLARCNCSCNKAKKSQKRVLPASRAATAAATSHKRVSSGCSRPRALQPQLQQAQRESAAGALLSKAPYTSSKASATAAAKRPKRESRERADMRKHIKPLCY
jgi:hypothetical protein